MTSALKWRAFVVMLAICATAGAVDGRAQSPPEASAQPGAKMQPSDPKRAKLIADTRRMLALSREVQAEMVKSGTETLSLGTMKKVEELQKLAATVKAEMGKLP